MWPSSKLLLYCVMATKTFCVIRFQRLNRLLKRFSGIFTCLTGVLLFSKWLAVAKKYNLSDTTNLAALLHSGTEFHFCGHRNQCFGVVLFRVNHTTSVTRGHMTLFILFLSWLYQIKLNAFFILVLATTNPGMSPAFRVKKIILKYWTLVFVIRMSIGILWEDHL